MQSTALRIVFALLLAGVTFAASATSPVGTWRIVGDKSGEAEALVEISEKNGVFEGKIVKIFPRPGTDPAARCELCSDARKNQPIKGMTILTGLRQEGDEFKGGEILDPDEGETYRCKMKLSADQRKLHVRGFIGISLIGRTQTWIRE